MGRTARPVHHVCECLREASDVLLHATHARSVSTFRVTLCPRYEYDCRPNYPMVSTSCQDLGYRATTRAIRTAYYVRHAYSITRRTRSNINRAQCCITSVHHAKNTIATRGMPMLSLNCIQLGSGRKITAIWHGAGAHPGVFILEIQF